jgi:hypothetical protein
MKKSIFDKIHSLEDIQKKRLRLEKKLKETGESFSDTTDLSQLLKPGKAKGRSYFETDYKLAIIESLLSLGVEYIGKRMQNSQDKKLIKKLIIYSVFGSISALLVYNYINNRKSESGE